MTKRTGLRFLQYGTLIIILAIYAIISFVYQVSIDTRNMVAGIMLVIGIAVNFLVRRKLNRGD